jgi:opacity protein-like surface antigen
MKKFFVLGVLAAILFLVPSVRAQEWYGSGAWGQQGYHHMQGPHKYHKRHQPPPRWRHANYRHGWQRPWHRQPARGGFNHSYQGWQYDNWRYR